MFVDVLWSRVVGTGSGNGGSKKDSVSYAGE
jgi:hypothetical protein